MRVLLLLLISALARDAYCLVGGENALLGDFNWMGSLRDANKMHVCGVVLAHRNWALTAGHCVGNTGYTLEFGHVVRGGGYVYPYDDIMRHPSYDVGTGYYPNDIAIIHIVDSGVSTEHLYTKPVTAFDTGSDRTEQTCWTAGWGGSCPGCEPFSQMQKVEIPVIGELSCNSEWPSYYNPLIHVCAWNETTQDSGLCDKDQGGSLVCDDGTGEVALVGLGSWFGQGCETALPSVFVRIAAFGDWACLVTMNDVCW